MMLSAASESGAHALRVGASVLAPAGADLTPAERRQRASLELLRLAAIEEGLLAAEDPTPEDGVLSEEAAEAIDAWVAQHVVVPDPDQEACRRHHADRKSVV